MEVRTPSDGFAATFPKGDGFYPDKLKFIAQLMARALCFQLSTMTPGIGVAMRPGLVSPRDRDWCRHATVIRDSLCNKKAAPDGTAFAFFVLYTFVQLVHHMPQAYIIIIAVLLSRSRLRLLQCRKAPRFR